MAARKDDVHLIMALNTGTLDGFYADRERASKVRAYLAHENRAKGIRQNVLDGMSKTRLSNEPVLWRKVAE